MKQIKITWNLNTEEQREQVLSDWKLDDESHKRTTVETNNNDTYQRTLDGFAFKRGVEIYSILCTWNMNVVKD